MPASASAAAVAVMITLMRNIFSLSMAFIFVIPAKAGIHFALNIEDQNGSRLSPG
jgi:thiosulfate reductase cytochrome b subunit